MVTRRSALHASGVVLGLGIAGCARSMGDSEPTRSPTASATETSTMTRSSPQPEALEFEAHVIQQQTAEAPARVRARLVNTGPPLRVGFGPTLLYTDNTAADELEWADELVIDPRTDVGPWDEPEQTEDGCWRFPRDGQRAVQSLLEGRDLATGEPITESYDVYTHRDSGPCLPEGTYQFEDKGYIHDESRPMILTLVLTVDANGKLSAGTEGPTFP